MSDFPKRGEVWIVNWNPARVSEQAGKRPALIIQNDIGNEKSPTIIIAAISRTVKHYPMNVEIRPPEGGLTRPSIVKTSQIMTISKERLEKRVGSLRGKKMAEVDKAIKLSLSLS
ncbi:MAG: type II toxin-antitoxin system PemK/MazF family toxin [Deltaproteobacteria bacterium]|nr:type II toxin-antitoxin system PemK/MazF family toxin [Deltaproteobacteria bacterium]